MHGVHTQGRCHGGGVVAVAAVLDRAVLLSPAAVARAAARAAGAVEESWLLRQPRAVRASYVREVLDADDPNAEEIWMLRQPRAVRESYITEVLSAPGGGASSSS